MISGPGPAIRALILIGLLFFSGSGTAKEILEELIEQRHAIDADGTLSVQNVDGSISIRASDGSEISIRAIKKAFTPDRLKSIVVGVKATPNGVAIETILPPKKHLLSLEDRSGIVDYTIAIPRTIRITRLDLNNGEVLVEGLHGGSATAHVNNGWLVAQNCFGDMDLSITNGRLQVAYDWWEEAKFRVRLSSPEGGIWAMIPTDASVNIAARATTGRIINDFASKKEEGNEPLRVLNLTVGSKPAAFLEMTSISGDIRIKKAN